MKLIDILVEHLEEWPEDVNYITGGAGRNCQIVGFGSFPTFDKYYEFWYTEEGHVWVDRCSLVEDWKEAVITKQMWLEAKQRNGNMNVSMNKQFTKADMKDGMRFVLRNGDVHYWCEDFACPVARGKYSYIKEIITDGLFNRYNVPNLDIMEVYALGELVWKRVEETEQEKKLKELRETIAKAEQQIKEIIGS